jgi:L-fuconolactonase
MIDAHVHIWSIGQHGCVWPTKDDGPIHRDFGLADLLASLDECDVDRALLVQSQESASDTAWLLEAAASCDRIAGVVGWADLRDGAAVSALSRSAPIRGLRPMVQSRSAGWYDDPDLTASLRRMAEANLVLDALIRPIHLPALDRLAARHPDLTIVIDHAAKPSPADGDWMPWRNAMAALAARPGVNVKISGLLSEMPRDRVAPTVATLLELFGEARLLWGSDWPVVTAISGYHAWFDLASDLIPERYRAAVFGSNAARVYGLGEAGHA